MKTRWLALMVMGGAVVLTGCGRKRTITLPGGTVVTTDGQGGSATIQTPQGTIKATTTTDGTDGRTVIEGPQGTIEANRDGGKSTITSSGPEGQTSMTHQEGDSGLTANELGIPFYPGAKVTQSNVIDAGQSKTLMVTLTTADEGAKVQEFYEGKLGKVDHKAESTTNGKTSRVLLQNGEKAQKTVTIETEGDSTSIMLIHLVNQ